MAILPPLCHKVAALTQIIRQWRLNKIAVTFLVVRLLLLVGIGITAASAQPHRVAERLAGFADHIDTMPVQVLLADMPQTDVRQEAVQQVVGLARFSSLQAEQHKRWRTDKPAFVRMSLIFPDGEARVIRLQQVSVLTPDFQINPGSKPREVLPWDTGLFYWGVVEGSEASLAAIAVLQDEVMGFVQIGEAHYTLGRLDNREKDRHILYATDDVLVQPPHACQVDEALHTVGGESPTEGNGRSGGNCFRLMVEVDHDIVVGKGGVQQAVDYMLGVFSQVAILYANEDIQLHLSQMVVWDVADPYTGPSSGQYLSQFGAVKNGQFNGDLAHLVGYGGTGGVAYLDVLCNPQFALGYSTIYASYQQVPVYSWTIMVLTHEIGHNLGSQHTHACAWNGNNTRIDNCGGQAGYTEGNCNSNPPLPANGGTIMSYCHLIGGVGINLNNGFGPQPGDRIRNRVYNASCLTACAPPIGYDAGIAAIVAPDALPCEAESVPVVVLANYGAQTLTSVTIYYQLDQQAVQSQAWTGNLVQGATTQVSLPAIGYSAGVHTLRVYTGLPNGQQDEVPSNDEAQFNFEYIPNYCDCEEAVAVWSPNPLTHSGSGQSSASLSFAPGSKNAAFTITGLSFKNNGGQNTRYTDRVVVSYVNGNGQSQTYGTFLGTQQSSVPVQIDGELLSITVTLNNALNNSYNGTLSINFSAVDYCGEAVEPCADADGDGVCDDQDMCPGMDDNWIGTACDDGDPCTSGDVYTVDCLCAGTPIPGCGEEPCPDPATSSLAPNPLTHAGSGSSNASVSLSQGHTDVSFTITGLNAVLNGNPNQRYNERAIVSYQNGNGQWVSYGTFLGSQQNTVEVELPGTVYAVQVNLSNALSPNNQLMSISFSEVSSCLPLQPIFTPGAEATLEDIQVYPNPTSRELFIRFARVPEQTQVRLFNALGVALGHYRFAGESLVRLDLEQLNIRGQWLFLAIETDGGATEMRSVLILE